jgi:hypothetical protein
MKRIIILIFLGFLLTSCGSMYQLSTLNHDPMYIDDVRVDVIENRMDLNWKLRTDSKFRWNFAQYAQNQPLSWYYDNSWELGLYRTSFSAFDFYWNRTQLWWDWAFGYPYNYGWNSWYPFGYNRWGFSYWNNWGWHRDPFYYRPGWNYGYGFNNWGWRNRMNDYAWNHRNDRNVVYINGRRGSNVVVTPNGGSSRGSDVVILNRGRNNNVNISEDVRRYRDKIISRKNIDDIARDLNNGRKVRTYENPNRVINNNNNNINRSNINNRPSRNYNVPRPNNNIRVTPPPTKVSPPVRSNIIRGSSNVGRSSSSVIRKNE